MKKLFIVGAILALLGIFGAAGSSHTPKYVEDTSTPQTVQQATGSPTGEAPMPQPAESTSALSNDNYYTNVDGNSVHSPAYAEDEDDSVPAGATAQCADGTYSFSQHRSGTCSHHGGVATWL